MHGEVLTYIKNVAHSTRTSRRLFTLAVEFGAYNMNGSARSVFKAEKWFGVDSRAGKGVDLVELAHEAALPGNPDLILCTEMLEHDPYAEESVRRMVKDLAPGGICVLTWAAPARKPHELDCSPEPGHYAAPTLSEVAGWILEAYTERFGSEKKHQSRVDDAHVLINPGQMINLQNGGAVETLLLTGSLARGNKDARMMFALPEVYSEPIPADDIGSGLESGDAVASAVLADGESD